MEQLTKGTREILISDLEKAMIELEQKKRIASKPSEFVQTFKIDCILIQQRIDGIKSILIDGEFEF